MEILKTEYEFLDLTDVKEADRSSLQCALFKTDANHNTFKIAATESVVDLSSSVNRGVVSACVSVEPGETAGAGEMAPQSPARGAPPYAQPPPAYPPPHQWPVAPPNVYVSQVTANVNVHGYMGQYYQPGPQYPGPGPTHPGNSGGARPHRRDRRTKRAPSPPPAPHAHHPPHAPYYLQYPQYYQAAQAQGAPLYHLPMYQPLVYGPYPYPPYYPDYPMPVEGDGGDKPPDDYPSEVVLEQEAVDAYYGGGQYAPAYQQEAVEYMPPVYLPPPPAPAPLPHAAPIHQHAPPHQPHQFNVHAKNFVAGQGKAYVPHEKPRSPPAAPIVSAAAPIDSLPMKDLKIATKGPVSPKHTDRPMEVPPKAAASPVEKIQPKPDPVKPVWTPPENKIDSGPNPIKTFVPVASTGSTPTSTPTAKLPPTIGKVTKGPAAPFSGGKQPPKPSTVPPSILPVQQTVTTPKPPFGNRQKREGPPPPTHRSSSSENVDLPLRDPPLPPSKAPMPISITLPTGAGGQPLIVANKPPFSRRPIPEPIPVPQPPPPAPTASDFPPPPTPRNRGELPPPIVTPQPQPAPGKSWASLFSNKSSSSTTTVAVATTIPIPVEEPPSPTSIAPPAIACQKPVAKVPPYDASPLAQQTPIVDKASPPRPAPLVTTPPALTPVPTISYSEKTSVNAVSASVPVTATTPVNKTPSPTNSEPREMPALKDSPPQPPVQPSPFCDDPNSYRMGEFLSKYQLDNRPVSLLPRGLTNRSNYCYVNSILQALIACPPFYNMLKALPYQTRRGKSSTPVIDSMVELCYEFSPLPSPRAGRGAAGTPAVQVPARPPLEGGAGLRVLRALRPFVGSQEGRQEDAEEFLGCLLNSLNDEMLELMKLVEPEESKETTTGQPPNGVIPQEQPPEEDDDDDEWKVMGPRNRGAVERRWAARRTPVADIFRGRTRVRLHRAPHHDVTDAVQPFFTLQLDIEQATSVKDALELLAGKDTLEGVSDAWQQLSIEQLPVVLLLHLKCFQLDAEGHTAKIVKNIDFPIDLKIDPKIMSSKQKYTSKQRLYKLFAVVYHEGVEAVKGHYVTDTYHGQVGWIRYDDSTVTQVTDGQVLKPKPPRMPYLLMYRRHDTLPQHRGIKE